MEWSEKKNIRWKTAIPGKGHASPIVWGNQVFVLSAVPHGEKLKVPEQPPGAHNNDDPDRKTKFVALALDRRSGKILWQTIVRNAQPHQSTHESGTWASASPVTDGQRIYAFFGSNGLYCLSTEGKLIWEYDAKGLARGLDIAHQGEQDLHGSACTAQGPPLQSAASDSQWPVQQQSHGCRWGGQTGMLQQLNVALARKLN